MKINIIIIFSIIIASCSYLNTVRVNKNDSCKTRYPILLVHGFGYWDDNKILPYWGRIPTRLRVEGAIVYLSGQDAFQPIEINASHLYSRIQTILAETGAEKINIIAHSKGGIEARYLITKLDKGKCVASLTTIATPHWGSSFADFAISTVDKYKIPAADLLNYYAEIIGDMKPESYIAALELTPKNMSNFNSTITDISSVYYQSCGAMMTDPLHDILFEIPYNIILSNEGKSDGIVPTNSCVWGNFKGFISGNPGGGGISHTEIIDLYRKDSSGPGLKGFLPNTLI